jgi:hypothetical protein
LKADIRLVSVSSVHLQSATVEQVQKGQAPSAGWIPDLPQSPRRRFLKAGEVLVSTNMGGAYQRDGARREAVESIFEMSFSSEDHDHPAEGSIGSHPAGGTLLVRNGRRAAPRTPSIHLRGQPDEGMPCPHR